MSTLPLLAVWTLSMAGSSQSVADFSRTAVIQRLHQRHDAVQCPCCDSNSKAHSLVAASGWMQQDPAVSPISKFVMLRVRDRGQHRLNAAKLSSPTGTDSAVGAADDRQRPRNLILRV